MFNKLLMGITTALMFQSCSTLNPTFKQVDPRIQSSVYEKKFEGASPKEVQKRVGDPMSVGWQDLKERGKVLYYMMYPLGEGEVSLLTFSSNANNRDCLVFFFWEQDNFKIKSGGGSNQGSQIHNCGLKLGERTFDDSLIEPAKK